MKRIALFVDGTWNLPKNNTNVWRLKQLARRDQSQVIYYHVGIGTDVTNRIRGAFGKGINSSVRDCYEWLVENYDDGDDVFIFGFSRGAYVARSVAGFVERCGLLRPGAPITVREVFESYRMWRGDTPSEWPLAVDTRLRRWSRRVVIEMLGIWDCVRYMDVPVGSVRGLSRSQNLFHVVEPFEIVRNTYHGLAIDEHRHAYRHELMRLPAEAESRGARLEQRWFMGAHSNVGGGYRNDTLSLVPLVWMQNAALTHGLKFRLRVELAGDEHLSSIVDSFSTFLSGLYRAGRLNRRHFRVIGDTSNSGEGAFSRSGGSHEILDASVSERWRRDPSYRPENLGECTRRLGLDLQTLVGDVRIS